MKKNDNRKLTKDEQARNSEFESLKSSLEKQGYKSADLTIGILYGNIMAFVLGIPIIILLGIVFINRNHSVSGYFETLNVFLFLAIMIVLIVAHELIHGVFWSIFTKEHWKAVSFGFIMKYLIPYCTCKEPLKKYEYIIGALMPTVILGIIPCLIAIFNGSVMLFLLGAIMILGGGGDLTIIIKLLCYNSNKENTIFIDHPYKLGLVAFVK